MTYEPLHHKYRPQTFADLVGQEAIAITLTSAIRQQKIAPAYLFTGPRGTGKTSSARILAKSLNCLSQPIPVAKPCGRCEVCKAVTNGSALDVIEIDAASNTGVDNIRELIERAQFAPVQCRYKVYVLDEVHMLSTPAFNALLKTLEEPPDRVVFILATTDPQRVLPTIISRCQRFDFRRIALEAMVGHLQAIATQEKIKIAPEAVQLVAQMAQGGLRDAESLLDQLSLLPEPITPERVWDLVGAVPERDLMVLLAAIAANNPEAVIEQARQIMDRGREPLVVLQNLAGFYRDLLIAKTAPQRCDLVGMTPATWGELCDLAESIDLSTMLTAQQQLRAGEGQIKNTTQPRLWLEVLLLGLLPIVVRGTDESIKPVSRSISPPPTQESAVRVNLPKVKQFTPITSDGDNTVEEQPAALVSAPERAVQPSLAARSVPDAVTAISLAPLPPQPDLEQLWREVTSHLQPFSTQALLRQLCRLVAIDAQQARIEITSQSWLKTSQEKLPGIEAAFQAVFKRPIKVRVEVAPIEKEVCRGNPPPATFRPKTAPTEHSTSPAPTNLSNSIPAKVEVAASLPLSRPQSQEILVERVTTEGIQIVQSTEPLQSATLPQLLAPTAQTEDEEVTRAAKSLAQFFNGEVVSPDKSSTNTATPDIATLSDNSYSVPLIEANADLNEVDLPF